jgi:hypothetical protein
MLYRSLAAALALFVIGGIVVAETYQGLITKISKDEVTIKVRKDKGKDAKSEEKTFKVGKDAKILKNVGKDKDPETASVEDVTKAIEKATKVKGVFGKVETEGEGDKETATKITFGGGGRPKKDKKKEDK